MGRIKFVLNERRLALIQAQIKAREPQRSQAAVEKPDRNLYEDAPAAPAAAVL